MERHVLFSYVKCPDGTELVYRGEEVCHFDNSGILYSLKGLVCTPPLKVHRIYLDSPHRVLRKYCVWGNRGLEGRDPLQFVPVRELDTDHIEAIIRGGYGGDYMLNVLSTELEYRNVPSEHIDELKRIRYSRYKC